MKRIRFLVGLLLLACSGCRAESGTVTLALLGDLSLGRGVRPQADSLAYLAPDLAAADLALANLESPLADDPQGTETGYDLCAPAPAAGLLPGWGLDLLALANNHRLDCGPAGDSETVSILTRLGLAPLGPGSQPVYAQVGGLPLAFLAFDDVSAPLDEPSALAAIRAARETGALVIVSVHWGLEYQGAASARQQTLAQEFAGAGAVLVWGHHPHVLQPAGWIATDGGRTLVLYSLGNALFDQGGLADTRRSALVAVTLDAGGVIDIRAVPFEIDTAASRLVAPNGETTQKILDRLNLP